MAKKNPQEAAGISVPAQASAPAESAAATSATDTAGPQEGGVAAAVEAPKADGPEAVAADSAGSAAGAVTGIVGPVGPNLIEAVFGIAAQPEVPEATGPTEPHLLVRSVSDRGRRRARWAFTTEPTTLLLSEVTEEELEELLGDTDLVITQIGVSDAG